MEKKIAQQLFTDQFKTQKEVAAAVGVTEHTLGKWAKDGNWKEIRNARHNRPKERIERIKEVIDALTSDHLRLIGELRQAEANEEVDVITELRKKSAALSHEIAMQTKALERMDKEFRISLSVYLHVMEDVFSHLRKHSEQVYVQTLDFQQEHLQHVANSYK